MDTENKTDDYAVTFSVGDVPTGWGLYDTLKRCGIKMVKMDVEDNMWWFSATEEDIVMLKLTIDSSKYTLHKMSGIFDNMSERLE